MKKILLRIAGFLLLLALISQILSGCLSFRMSSKEIDDYFKEKQLSYQLDTFPFKDYSIHYISTDNDSLPLVIFVHGSPGSLSSFIEFAGDKTLRKNVSMISIDRPGYGESNYGKSMESLKEQAKCIQTLVNQKSKNRSVILVGHSLGGPIIATVAMEYPDLVQGLIFVGASVSAELEPEENWFRYPLYTPLLRWVLPKSFRVTNDEIYKLKPQLEKMED
ncbi:MAG: epoxide hydrolase 1, partial [Cyclobacteriaceae bacterium]|nr:epoxide hydrolase 1 [Cyclobacteriaceae bacterium]